MPGFSLSVFVLPRSGPFTSGQVLEYLDTATDAPGWPWHAKAEPVSDSIIAAQSATEVDEQRGSLPVLKRESSLLLSEVSLTYPCRVLAASSDVFVGAIKRAAEALVAAEPEITRQDTIAGDGDAGLTLKSGAEGAINFDANASTTSNNTPLQF